MDAIVSGTEGVGSAAEEATRLFQAAEQWARTRGATLLDSEHLATGEAACSICPLCRGVDLLRQVKPETVEHLLDAAASFVAALRTTVVPPTTGDDPGRPARVQHIDVREG